MNPKKSRVGKGGTGALILKHLPDFCWQTAREIFYMVEQLNWGIDIKLVEVTLINLHKNGLIEKKVYDIGSLYRGYGTVYVWKAKEKLRRNR
jgi:hypothetical protein